jgi:hypothetical protein
MDAALIIGSALLSGLVGVWLGARQRERERLGGHLSEYGAALDALTEELRTIPQVGKTATMLGDLLERKLPTLDFYFARLAKATLARGTYFEVERLRVATNNLILSAPPPVLFQAEQISRHLQGFSDRDRSWFSELRVLREELARISREVVGRRMYLVTGVRVSGRISERSCYVRRFTDRSLLASSAE